MIDYAALLGIFPMPLDGQSRNAPPSDEDIARVAVAALTDPAKHAGKIYRPTGPEMLSVQEMTGIMGRVVGREVRHIRVPMWLFLKAARMGGIDRFLLSSTAQPTSRTRRAAPSRMAALPTMFGT